MTGHSFRDIGYIGKYTGLLALLVGEYTSARGDEQLQDGRAVGSKNVVTPDFNSAISQRIKTRCGEYDLYTSGKKVSYWSRRSMG